MGVTYGTGAFERLKEHDIPAMIFPESVATTLALIDKYRRWLSRPEGTLVKTLGDKKKVAAIIKKHRAGDRKRPSSVMRLFRY